ncbi:MAG: hypothetical protein WA860_14190, partial [Acidimicrobiales bacterium]
PLQNRVSGNNEWRQLQIVENNDEIIFSSCDDGMWTFGLPDKSFRRGGLIVAYLTDFPRLDEIDSLATVGVNQIVLPFRRLPAPMLKFASNHGIKIVDWERANKYVFPRPQWEYVGQVHGPRHVYKRERNVRVIGLSRSSTSDLSKDLGMSSMEVVSQQQNCPWAEYHFNTNSQLDRMLSTWELIPD